MKKIFLAVSLFFSILMIFTGCIQKEPIKETKASVIVNEDLQDIKNAQTEIQNIQRDTRNTLTEIQNTQKEILAKLSDIQKKVETSVKAAPQGRAAIDINKIYKLPIAHSPVKGNKNAPVTIVEFSDFQCPYCAQLQTTLNEVLRAYPQDVKLVFKHFPLSFHHQAMNAAKATEAAREQDKFWEMHDIIFQNFNKLTEQSFKEFAQQLGLNIEKFSSDFTSSKYNQQIQQDIALGRNSDVGGTPTLFLNGKKMQSRSFNDFKQLIDTILKK